MNVGAAVITLIIFLSVVPLTICIAQSWEKKVGIKYSGILCFHDVTPLSNIADMTILSYLVIIMQ